MLALSVPGYIGLFREISGQPINFQRSQTAALVTATVTGNVNFRGGFLLINEE